MFETMTLNFGPSHPATHGTLRVVMRVDGEKIVAAESECGYLHRCFEKMSETHTWVQVVPYTDRLNYCSPMINGNGYARAVEQMLGVDGAAAREGRAHDPRPSSPGSWTTSSASRRTSSTSAALTNFWYAYQPREEIYGLLEACCGARLTSSYARIGGLANDVPGQLRRVVAVAPAR